MVGAVLTVPSEVFFNSLFPQTPSPVAHPRDFLALANPLSHLFISTKGKLFKTFPFAFTPMTLQTVSIRKSNKKSRRSE